MISTLYLKIWKNRIFYQIKKNPIFSLFPIILIAIIVFVSIKLTKDNIALIQQNESFLIKHMIDQSILSSSLISLTISILLFLLFKNSFFRSNILKILPISNAKVLMIELLPFILLTLLFICILYLPTYLYLFFQGMEDNIFVKLLFLVLFMIMNISIILFSFVNVYFLNVVASVIVDKIKRNYLHEIVFFFMAGIAGFIYFLLLSKTNVLRFISPNIFSGSMTTKLTQSLLVILCFILLSMLFYIVSLLKKKPVDASSTILAKYSFTDRIFVNIFLFELKRVVRDYHRIFTICLFFILLLLLNMFVTKYPENNVLMILSQFSPLMAIELIVIFPLLAAARDHKKVYLLYLLPFRFQFYMRTKLTFYLLLALFIGAIYFISSHLLTASLLSTAELALFFSELVLFSIIAFVVGILLPFNTLSGLQEGVGFFVMFIIYFSIIYIMNYLGVYQFSYMLILSTIFFIITPFLSKRVLIGSLNDDH